MTLKTYQVPEKLHTRLLDIPIFEGGKTTTLHTAWTVLQKQMSDLRMTLTNKVLQDPFAKAKAQEVARRESLPDGEYSFYVTEDLRIGLVCTSEEASEASTPTPVAPKAPKKPVAPASVGKPKKLPSIKVLRKRAKELGVDISDLDGRNKSGILARLEEAQAQESAPIEELEPTPEPEEEIAEEEVVEAPEEDAPAPISEDSKTESVEVVEPPKEVFETPSDVEAAAAQIEDPEIVESYQDPDGTEVEVWSEIPSKVSLPKSPVKPFTGKALDKDKVAAVVDKYEVDEVFETAMKSTAPAPTAKQTFAPTTVEEDLESWGDDDDDDDDWGDDW